MDYIDIFKNGSNIHIKKKNKGKFTDYCGGHVTEECIQRGKHSSNPTTRKRATFADNARKWKHLEGGVAKYGKGFYSSEDLRETNLTPILNTNLLNRVLNYESPKREVKKETEDTGWDDLFNEEPQQVTTTVSTVSLRPIDKSKARGDRNNNWLNLRISDSNWVGKLANNTDGAFELFETAAQGFRAGLKNIQNHIKRGKQTVGDLISVWAPESDNNNTISYIRNVLQRTGLKSTDILNPNDKNLMINLAYAMAISENGYAPNRQDIEAGWNLLSKV